MNEDMKQVEKQVATFEAVIVEKYNGADYDEKTLSAIRTDATAFADWVTGTLTKKHVSIVWGFEKEGIIMLTVRAESDEGPIAFARIETKKKPNVPTIRDAKILAEKYGQDGVVIFFFNGDQYGFSSFGNDRKQCEKFGKFGNRVADLIESKDIKV